MTTESQGAEIKTPTSQKSRSDSIIVGVGSFLFGCLAMLALPYLLEYYHFAIATLAVFVIGVFVVFIFRNKLTSLFKLAVQEYLKRSLLPVVDRLESALKSDGKPTGWLKEGRAIIEVGLERYMVVQFRKWLISLVFGCFALMIGLFSFHALNEQNKLLSQEMIENTNISKAQLKMSLKEEYINWRDKVPLMKENSSYHSLISKQTNYEEYLNQYWSVVVRQEYEALMGNGSSGETLEELFLEEYCGHHKNALTSYPVLDTARVEYLRKRKERIDTTSTDINFYTYLYLLEPFSLD